MKLKEYGADNVTRPFGIELGDGIEGRPGNCGVASFWFKQKSENI